MWMWAFFSLSMVGICVSIVFLIRKFANANVTWVIRGMTAYAWLTAMMVIALVPIDCWSSYEPPASTQGIAILWNIAYWSTQLATWIFMPFFQVYADAGDFNIKNRAWTSLKENALLYGAIGFLGFIGIVIILASAGLSHWMDLLNIGVFCSNAFGLIAGLLLMGYGLVEIPRSMWVTSNPTTDLKWCAHRCGKYAQAVMQSTNEMRTVAIVIYANQRQMRSSDALKPFMDIISDEAEKQSPIKPSAIAQENIDMEALNAEDLEYNFDKKGLSALRRRMFWAIADYQGARAQYSSAMLDAFELEDIIKCRSLKDYTPRAPADRSPSQWARWGWHYKCVTRPYANKVFAVLLGITSCLLVWGEITIPVQSKDLSPFSKMLHSPDLNEFIFQILAVLPLIYMCACSYYTLFKINIDNKYFQFNYNKLIPHATTGAALMQNGSLMCRFAAPTCWNFYHIIRFAKDYCTPEQSAAGECHPTVFSTIMASFADMSAFKYININTYLPVILVVHCAMVMFGVWDRLINLCVSDRHRFSTDDVDDEYTEKGRLLIRREQEATAKGFAIGDVLHSAYFDLEFPTIANYGRYGKKKPSFFKSLFGKKEKPGANGAATANGHGAGPAAAPVKKAPKPGSAAAMAAERWLRTGNNNMDGSPGGSNGPGAGSSNLPGVDGTDDRVSLLGAKGDESAGGHVGPGVYIGPGIYVDPRIEVGRSSNVKESANAGSGVRKGGESAGGYAAPASAPPPRTGAGGLDSLFSGLSSAATRHTSSFSSSTLGGASAHSSTAAAGYAGGAAGAGAAAGAVGSRLAMGAPAGPGVGASAHFAPLAAGSGGSRLNLGGGPPPATGGPSVSGVGVSAVSAAPAPLTSTKLVFGGPPAQPAASGASFTSATKLFFGGGNK